MAKYIDLEADVTENIEQTLSTGDKSEETEVQE